ncbi:MAG: Gfo/Idh/MocA family oxidoreductase [Bacteroidia bacterium]|nr:Gfo/Idh/MocA family oxidoreductase [Bacteroidia bacterium]MBT8274868.1 Gfo/Idh/MocA family oxidoreductase [Bacteroidia bacterium]NNF30644.1 Gfo/Idh/MocA family oxidoreductase [Flavobacteriaceae bacterium]NNK54911.1 Gfo/Idh/MocA family oxidoreductase [Flavobacteriaceae bacterium]NNM07908.1 Gfo/Idh/MocA family oxidoreductase [Flavobacteriaceae bacterium]
MSKKLRWGVLGGGGESLIGVLHRVAASMFDSYQLTGAVFNPVYEKNLAFAEEIGIPTNRIYLDFDTMVEAELALPKEERIEVFSVLTPNYLHFPMAKKLLESGFHVICEKPMTMSYAEALELEEIRNKNNNIFALTHTYTGYPMVRQMKKMIAGGAIGKVQKVDAQYYQGWINPIIHDPKLRATTWRLDPEKSGISCCMGDIGVHAYQMLEYMTGMDIQSVLADLNYLYEDNKMDIDGTVLLRLGDQVKGVLRASQIATAEENNFSVAVFGREGTLKWEQENPNYLYLLKEGKPIQTLKPGNSYNSELSLDGTKLPPGHPEGIFDAMGNIYKGVAKAIRGHAFDKAEFPGMRDGVRGMKFIETVVASHLEGNVWKSI